MDGFTMIVLMLIGFSVVFALLILQIRRRLTAEDKVLKGYFLLGLSGLMAKIAMADGSLDVSESDLAVRFFKHMKLTEAEHAMCVGNFISAQRSQETIRDLSNRFIAYATPAACEFLYVLLWQISKADGILDPKEESTLVEVARCLGISSILLEKLKAGAKPSFSTAVLRSAGVPESLVALA